jgi:hypothetical protein
VSQSAFDLLHPVWHHRAACTGQTDLMFSVDPADKARARGLCVICPVREACLAAALLRSEPDGIWGGFDEPQRRALMRRLPNEKFAQ